MSADYTKTLVPAFTTGAGPNFDFPYGASPKSAGDGAPAPPLDWGGTPADTCTQYEISAFLIKYGKTFSGQFNFLNLQVEALQDGTTAQIIPGEQARDNQNLDEDQLRWSGYLQVGGFTATTRYLLKHIMSTLQSVPNDFVSMQDFFKQYIPALDLAAVVAPPVPPPFWS